MYARGLSDISDLPTLWPFGRYDCSQPALWALAPALCWKYPPSAWAQIAGFPNPFSTANAPTAVAPTQEQLSAVKTPEDAQALIDSLLKQGWQSGTEAIQKSVETQGGEVPENPKSPSGLSTWAWLAIAGAVVAGVFLFSGGSRRYR